MPLPATGQISFNDLKNEFLDSDPIKISDYYRGGSLVPNIPPNLNIPTSGEIKLSNFYGSMKERFKGYIGAGQTASPETDIIESFNFTNEVTVATSAFVTLRYNPAGVVSAINGYIGGGNRGNIFAEIDGINFFTETNNNPLTSLTEQRYVLQGVESNIRGYFAGGLLFSGSVTSDQIDGIQFDTEAQINPNAALATRRRTGGGVNSSLKGYFGFGGFNTVQNGPFTFTNIIDALTFSNETTANTGATVAAVRAGPSGVQSSIKGYFGGGSTAGPTFQNGIDSITFSNESSAPVSISLTVARGTPAGINSRTNGIWCGGQVPSPVLFSGEIDGINFATEATYNPTSSMVRPRFQAAGL